jgi:uncharacterized protein with PIN domain
LLAIWCSSSVSSFRQGPASGGVELRDRTTYVIAAVSGLPLLYTGNDFAKTDISSA